MDTLSGYFQDKDVKSLQLALREGRITCRGLVLEALESIEALNPTLNAFVHIAGESALEAARQFDEEGAKGWWRGPLHGLPIAVKDNIDVAGMPTTYGSHFFATHVPTSDASVISRLRDAGAIIIGKTLTSEFALGPTGEFSLQGAARNPHNPDHMSGGSSAGSAVAVASGMVPFALGTDTAGSIRIPAGFCGIVGFKPSYQTISTQGVFPVSGTLDHVGPMAKTVADASILYHALVNADQPQTETISVKRVGWINANDLINVAGEVDVACRAAVQRLFPDATQIEVSIADFSDRARALFTTVFLSEGFEVHQHRMLNNSDVFSQEQYNRLLPGGKILAWEYVAAKKGIAELVIELTKLFDQVDVLVMPTLALTAPLIGSKEVCIQGKTYSAREAINMLTSLWSLAGFPAVSVPAENRDGLPCGLQVVMPLNTDSQLMSVLAQA
jgi:aspartyl-tRNA(Asn)/glutamyl-tRNA(Gln) amidotransferase subunit A